METHTLDQRRKFIHDLASAQWSMSELCARFGVSRPTGYKWLARHRGGGATALRDRSHAPHDCPHRTAARLEALLLAARREYGWGAKKLLASALPMAKDKKVEGARLTGGAYMALAWHPAVGAKACDKTPCDPASPCDEKQPGRAQHQERE